MNAQPPAAPPCALGPSGRARPRAAGGGQRGAALLMAMVIVTLVATMAASMVWQQWRSVQVEGAERVRSQAGWVLSGALDWARLILKEDAKTGQATDHLGEPWALPLAEARLSTFLAADRENSATDDDSPEAFLSGKVEDAQAKYNLANLVEDDVPAQPGGGGDTPGAPRSFKVKEDELLALQKLCEGIGLPRTLADGIAQSYLRAYTAWYYKVQPNPALLAKLGGEQGRAQAPLLPTVFDDIGWLGLDAGTVERLRPFVTILPSESGSGGASPGTPINVNTASKEVIAAVSGLDIGVAGRLVQSRQRQPFKILEDVARAAGTTLPENADSKLRVQSEFFEVSGRLRYEDNIIEQRHLVQRKGLDDVIVLHQSRFSGVEPVGQGASPP